jgi:hypothetical protein
MEVTLRRLVTHPDEKFSNKQKKGPDLPKGAIRSFDVRFRYDLRLSYPEHFRTANRAGTLSGRFPILHCNCLRVLYCLLGPTFHTIGFHAITSPF